jgi:hypothetical protein
MIPSRRKGISAVLGLYLNKNIITIKAFHINFILIGLDGQRVIIFGGDDPLKFGLGLIRIDPNLMQN